MALRALCVVKKVRRHTALCQTTAQLCDDQCVSIAEIRPHSSVGHLAGSSRCAHILQLITHYPRAASAASRGGEHCSVAPKAYAASLTHAHSRLETRHIHSPLIRSYVKWSPGDLPFCNSHAHELYATKRALGVVGNMVNARPKTDWMFAVAVDNGKCARKLVVGRVRCTVAKTIRLNINLHHPAVYLDLIPHVP